MKRAIAIVLIGVFTLFKGGIALAASPPVAAAVGATFLLDCGAYTGTAWQFSPGLYLTANHVVVHCRTPMIVSKSGAHRSNVILHNTLDDVAELKSSFIAPSSIPIRVSSIATNEKLYVRAAPGGRLETSSGRLIGDFPVDGIPSIETSAFVDPGSSGGVVINESGDVVGLVQKKSTDPTFGVALRQPFISGFLARKLPGTDAGPLPISSASDISVDLLWMMVATVFSAVSYTHLTLPTNREV